MKTLDELREQLERWLKTPDDRTLKALWTLEAGGAEALLEAIRDAERYRFDKSRRVEKSRSNTFISHKELCAAYDAAIDSARKP